MKLLVWDFDGTLARRDGMWTGALCEILEDKAPQYLKGRDSLRAELKTGFYWHTPDKPHPDLVSPEQWWDSLSQVFVRAFSASGANKEESHILATHVRNYYCDIRRWIVFPDVRDTLTRLSNEGWEHMILSNHVPELKDILRGLHLDQYFFRVVNSAITGYEKPNPMAYAFAIEGLSELDAIWMIGDSLTSDVKGAERYGWKAILVRKFSPEARYVSEKLVDVISILKDANRRG